MNKEQIIEILKTIKDPELGLDIWTLELIYDITIQNENVKITMTLTTPMCPFGPQIIQEVKDKTKGEVEVTFEPPWKASDDLRSLLGV